MSMNPISSKSRCPKAVERLAVPNPLAPGYMGTYSPPVDYKIAVIAGTLLARYRSSHNG